MNWSPLVAKIGTWAIYALLAFSAIALVTKEVKLKK